MVETDTYTEILGPKAFNTWSKESPLWWISYRTQIGGSWNKSDISEFKSCKAKYIIFFDHSLESDARLLALKVLERDSHFKAAKVSKFARDGEKILVLIGKDDTRKAKLSEVAKQCGFILWGVKGLLEQSTLERKLNSKYSDYLNCLAQAFTKNENSDTIKITDIEGL